MATISLGGVWEDLHSQLKAALDAQFNAETLLKDTILEKDALMIKIDAIEVTLYSFLPIFDSCNYNYFEHVYIGF